MTAALHVATPEDARALTDRIKIAVDGTWELIKQAFASRAWSTLGYTSWDDYCTREFGTSRLRIPREDRPEAVASMRESGMSIRAIESATGYGFGTIQRELSAGDPNGSPGPDLPEATSTPAEYDPESPDDDSGRDDHALTEAEREALDTQWDGEPDESGMTDAELARQAEQMEAESRPVVTGLDGKTYKPTAPRKPKRKPITDAFWTATYDLGKKVTTLTNLASDDRFNSNADQIRERNLQDLIRARDGLQSVIDQLSI